MGSFLNVFWNGEKRHGLYDGVRKGQSNAKDLPWPEQTVLPLLGPNAWLAIYNQSLYWRSGLQPQPVVRVIVSIVSSEASFNEQHPSEAHGKTPTNAASAQTNRGRSVKQHTHGFQAWMLSGSRDCDDLTIQWRRWHVARGTTFAQF